MRIPPNIYVLFLRHPGSDHLDEIESSYDRLSLEQIASDWVRGDWRNSWNEYFIGTIDWSGEFCRLDRLQINDNSEIGA